MEEDTDRPEWENKNAYKSLLAAHDYAEKNADERIKWYERKSKFYGGWARRIRFLSIFLTGIGALCQLLEVTKLWTAVPKNIRDLTTLSYVAFALVAGLFALDKYFGFSAGWIRFMTTQLALQRTVVEFHYDFALSVSQIQAGGPSPTQAGPMLQRIKTFALQIETLVKQETDAWAVEFQKSIAELEKLTRTELDKSKPGGIKVAVSAPKSVEKVEVFKNGVGVLSLSGTGEGLIPNLAPGFYTISAMAHNKDGSSLSAEKVIEVQSGKMESTELIFS